MRRYSTRRTSLILLWTVVLILIWAAAAALVGNDVTFPSPISVAGSARQIISQTDFAAVIFGTLLRSAESFLIALLLAVVLGSIAAFSDLLYNLLLPVHRLLGSMPTMAFIVMALIWFSKNAAPILLGCLISFPILYTAVVSAIWETPEQLCEMADCFAVPFHRIYHRIYLPRIVQALSGVLYSTFLLILKVVIAGELYSQPKFGIGTEIVYEKMAFNTGSVLAWILLVAVLAMLIDGIACLIRRLLVKGGKLFGTD